MKHIVNSGNRRFHQLKVVFGGEAVENRSRFVQMFLRLVASGMDSQLMQGACSVVIHFVVPGIPQTLLEVKPGNDGPILQRGQFS